MQIVMDYPAYFIAFLHSLLLSPTYIYVAVIALFFGLVPRSLAGVIFVPVVAVLVFIAAETVGPVFLNHAVLAVPGFDLALAKLAVAAYAVFLVLDAVVFGIKKAVLKIVD